MGRERPWTKDQERQWRSTFTRDNYLGAKKLEHALRTIGPEAVARKEKERSLNRMEEGVRAQVAGAFGSVTEQMMDADRILVGPEGEAYTKAGVKDITHYGTNAKVVETFDGCGNLVSVETIPYQ